MIKTRIRELMVVFEWEKNMMRSGEYNREVTQSKGCTRYLRVHINIQNYEHKDLQILVEFDCSL